MIPVFDRKLLRVVVVATSLASVSGCYYMQAARGQIELMNKRESIEELIEADDTPAVLSARLKLVNEARQFSIDELGMPDNDSYRSYADIERNYVVWNIFAAAEFSLEPKTWCFPVAGCISYRGYFSEDSARKEAAKLSDDGYDVAVGGVIAYSTLGKFSDPILNTMMQWSDNNLIAVMFHELAHQILYVKGDSGFNESFATAVEEFAIDRWLKGQDQESDLADYRERRELQERLMQHIEIARTDLTALYSSPIAVAEMRLKKRERLEQLQVDLSKEAEQSGRDAPGWLSEDLNNARLASMSLYQGRLPEFRVLLADCGDDIRCFYAQARVLAESEPEATQRK